MTANAASPPRAVLADDERLMREQLRARLAEVWPELQIVAEAKNGLEAVQLVQSHRPDIVFLDIRMPGLTGIEAARQITQLPEDDDDALLPEIVFITAYDEYAVQAFEQGVADYVLKPAERERLAMTVQRIQKRLAARRDPTLAAAAPAAMPMQQLLQQLLQRRGEAERHHQQRGRALQQQAAEAAHLFFDMLLPAGCHCPGLKPGRLGIRRLGKGDGDGQDAHRLLGPVRGGDRGDSTSWRVCRVVLRR